MCNSISSPRWKQRVARGLLGMTVLASLPLSALASSWSPTLLVNNEAFETISDGDGSSPIFLQFGDSAAEKIIWDVSSGQFIFTDDVAVQGNITASGSLSINADDTGDATMTFVGPGVDNTITFSDVQNVFKFSSGATFAGVLSGASLRAENIKSCSTLTTDSQGRVTCNGTTYMNVSDADARYVRTSGGTMTGALRINNAGGLATTGTITSSGGLTINDQGAGSATLTFGGPVVQTITYNSTARGFEFSSGAYLNGNLRVTGSMSGRSLALSTGNVTINGVAYSFTNTQGAANTVLKNNGAGSLTWVTAASLLGSTSGSMLALSPEYSDAVYEGDGSNNVGTLATKNDGTSNLNYYRWTTTRATLQDYDIYTRVRVPLNFTGWRTGSGLQLMYRTTDTTPTNNGVRIRVLDTAGVASYDSGATNLVSASSTFVTRGVSAAALTGTFTPGGVMTVRITVSALTAKNTDVSNLYLNWQTTTP